MESGGLGRQRGEVCSERNHVVLSELLNSGFHQGAANSRPCALLEVVELADDIARRATSNPGYRANAFEVGAMADSAWDCLAGTAGFCQGLTFGDTADRRVHHELRS